MLIFKYFANLSEVMKKTIMALCLLVMLIGCTAPQKELTIGVILPLSGDFSSIAENHQKALQLADKELGSVISDAFKSVKSGLFPLALIVLGVIT